MEILVSTIAKLMKNNMEIGKNIEIQWEEEKKNFRGNKLFHSIIS